MIPKSEYVKVPYGDDAFIFVITHELFAKHHSKKEVETFGKWMRGQTCMALPDGKAGIYSWDYERWLKQGKKTEQGDDWD